MSDPIAITFDLNANLVALTTLIAALAAAAVTIINAWNVNKKQKTTEVKVDAIDHKTNVIEKQTNGTLSNAREEIAALKAANEVLHRTNARLTGDRRKRELPKKKR